jgi:septal ring factor EnvC (AmiA/AmiB activator)
MTRALLFVLAMLCAAPPAAAQDVRGLEICTAEKSMERRTSCLQSNAEFLHQALAKLAHETHDKLTAASREAAAQKAEIAALKAELAKLHAELAELKKPKPDKK